MTPKYIDNVAYLSGNYMILHEILKTIVARAEQLLLVMPKQMDKLTTVERAIMYVRESFASFEALLEHYGNDGLISQARFFLKKNKKLIVSLHQWLEKK